jgi:hypothetical protein
MNKLFHEVALQPEAARRGDALTIFREIRLDHSRYIQALPDDLHSEMVSIIKENPDGLQHKKLAMLETIRSSIVATRSRNPSMSLKAKDWRELVSIEGRNEPFDVLIGEKEIFCGSDKKELDSYLFDSEGDLGSVTKSFGSSEDWLRLIKPVIMSDNSLVIVDRYFDPGRVYYSKLFSALIGWLKRTRICFLRIFIGAPTVEHVDSTYAREHFDLVCDGLTRLIASEQTDFRASVIVTYRSDLHLRYLGTKVCALELDYGFRLSGGKAYKVSVMRPAGLKDFKNQFFSEIKFSSVLANKVIWPMKKV